MIRLLTRVFEEEKKPVWKGSPTELLDEVTQAALQLKIQVGLNTNWPRSPQPFSRRLNDLIPALNKKGYDVVSKNGTPRTIIISPSIQSQLFNNPPKPEEKKLTIIQPSDNKLHYIRLCQSDVNTHKCEKCNQLQAEYKDGHNRYLCPRCFSDFYNENKEKIVFVDDTMPDYEEANY